MGRIGNQLVRKADKLFGRIIAADPYKPADYFSSLNVERVALDLLLQQSHISIHCNLTEETRHLIDQKAFSHMRNRPVLVNTERGSVIDSWVC